MGEGGTDLRWGVQRRIEFIEFRLFWDGRVNRSDLMEIFGISVQQASADLNRYLALAPGNLVYDRSARTYVRGPKFFPRFLKPDAAWYLSQLRLVADGVLDNSKAWIGEFPSYDAVPTPTRGVSAEILRAVIAAISGGQAIEIRYQSLSRPEPRWRWIRPHAIGFDGFRWHARAFCEIDQTFKDFLLSRILQTAAMRASDATPEMDTEWHQTITLEIGPHPDLPEMQKNVIALDYGMKGGSVEIPVRRAFLYYALKRLGLDTDPAVRRPQDQQIVLLNRDDLLAFRDTPNPLSVVES